MEKMILLIEDNEDDAKLTQIALESNHIANKLVVIDDGAEALEYIFCQGKYAQRDIKDIPTVILLDIKLPKVSGLQILEKIRADKRTNKLPVVLLTSSTEENDMIKAYEKGCNSYICKPVDFQQFSEAIKQLGLYWLVLNNIPINNFKKEALKNDQNN
ncbi:MAG: response regulator [Candidatus Omnitrophica bacterium]|nr:response regulator [Candidatus Omnitrophota bacterium]MBU1996190.1 response regulator [Candidatus Omnitrophota bacterium]